MSARQDYGRAGLVGIGAPQANPTVEAEMRILMPPAVAMAVARLTASSPDPLERLSLYLERLEDTLAQYDSLRPQAFGFACTGSSYLLNPERVTRIVVGAQQRFGYPVVTATAAICWQLRRLGAQRIALASPYPPALSEAAVAFWRNAGFDIVESRAIETGSGDTRSIYALGSADARPAVDALRRAEVDAVLLSGTGMPSLALVGGEAGGPPVISSNLCLALRLCDLIGATPPDSSDWRARLTQTLSSEGSR